MKNICVFCSSSDGIEEIYYKEAQEIGKMLAKQGYNLVYGGSTFGLMGTVAKAAKQFGSKIIGVMPQRIYDLIAHENVCDEFHLTTCMRERKAKMDELSDAVITLPGGFGTLEEASEMIVQKLLGYNTKPVVFLNTNNFYDKLLEFFNQIISERFALDSTGDLYYVAKTPQEAVEYIANYVPNKRPENLEEIYVTAK